jgi:hypothetical protein
LKHNTAIANRDEHSSLRRVNLLTEEGYNLLKLTVEVGAIQ